MRSPMHPRPAAHPRGDRAGRRRGGPATAVRPGLRPGLRTGDGARPEQVTREYFAQFAPPPPVLDAPEEPPKDTSRGVTPLAIATFGIAAGLAVALFLGRSWVARPPSPAGQATARPVRRRPHPADRHGSRGASRRGRAPCPLRRRTLGTRCRSSYRQPPVWVTANADGRRALFQIVLPGSPQTVSAAREIKLRVGDAGALRG